MIVLALAAVLAAGPLQDPAPPQAARSAPDPDAPVALEDVEVTGRPLEAMIRSFVDEVAAPNKGRALARWDDRICIGVANLMTDPAQYIVDRVSTVADDIGLTPGAPGCQPNVIIIASGDPGGLTRRLIDERRRAFRLGGAGMDRGGAALQAFETSDEPVRWWQVSMPTDTQTGMPGMRIPGECRDPCGGPMDYAPTISMNAASRLSTQVVEKIIRTVVVIDIDKISDVSLVQLADYIAMVTLAQIDPDADTSQFASILNVFDEPDAAAGLTDWDRAYLQGLYASERSRRDLDASRTEIASSIRRAHQNLRAADSD